MSLQSKKTSDPEERLKEYKEQSENIIPVKELVLKTMMKNKDKTGREELVDFKFVSGKYNEMKSTQQQLTTLQQDLTFQVKGKNQALANCIKLLNQQKADYEELKLDDFTQSSKKIMKKDENSNALQNEELNTLISKQFYNIDDKKKMVQDLSKKNAEFCFAVYSTLNQKVVRTMVILKELMYLFNMQGVFVPDSSIFSSRLYSVYVKNDTIFYGSKKKESKEASPQQPEKPNVLLKLQKSQTSSQEALEPGGMVRTSGLNSENTSLENQHKQQRSEKESHLLDFTNSEESKNQTKK